MHVCGYNEEPLRNEFSILPALPASCRGVKGRDPEGVSASWRYDAARVPPVDR